MNKKFIYTSICCLGLTGGLSSCGEDRSGEYYALIASKTWIYETMQEHYLFYEDLPAKDQLDFFMKPADFVKAAASPRDKKNGVSFSHADSIAPSRIQSEYPSFGLEVDYANTPLQGTPVMRILYVQPHSPAYQAGMKRGDWIIAVDSAKVSSTHYMEQILRPTQAHEFMMGKYITPQEKNGKGKADDNETLAQAELDTLHSVKLTPAYVEIQNLLEEKVIDAGNGRKALYLLYNEFGQEDIPTLQAAFSRNQGVDDIILDLRYNPGGFVKTSHVLSTCLAPQEAMGQVFLNMTYNDKINKTEILPFDHALLPGGTPLSYRNLYIITSASTASASEIVINCLRPYMEGRLFQVGAATFGKNVAQQLFTSEAMPQVELWLTTTLLSNCDNYSDYFTHGLLPDFEIEENTIHALGEFGTANDRLLQPVLYHIQNGSFPATEENDGTAAFSRNSKQDKKLDITYTPAAYKAKWNKLDK